MRVMVIVNSTRDIQVWIQNNRSDVTGDDVFKLIDAMVDDGGRPSYGTDWSDFLETFDYTYALT